MDEAEYARARRLLMRRDPVLAAIIKRHGACGLAAAQRTDHFAAIVKAITSQQLSTKASRTIFNRFVALFPDGRFPTPADVIAIDDERLRNVGLSRQKVAYIRDLCMKVTDGTLPLRQLDAMDDEQVIEAITRVKGLGRWTAEMFLMFRLHRPDVLPVGDLGILRAMQKAYGLRKPPGPERMRRIGEAWKPYRSIACWYLWQSLENEPT
ncbi:MAG: DNA-3-methyladenine glycosylase [Acidobacteria bacterium]|nr:DNA-3-methyladenine glycosylase [Acidobacteriota bacterium]